jgi:hypothetical protein
LYLRTSFINATETVADIVSKSKALMRGKTQAGTHANWRNERLKNRNPKFRNEKWIHISIHDFDVWHSFRLNPEG